MNTANLQLEGLYLAITAVHETLIARGAITRDQLETALKTAEQTAINEDRATEGLSPAERDALAFPARLLLRASMAHDSGELPGFTALARQVGQTKHPYNDQM